jgi:hypothetical protein
LHSQAAKVNTSRWKLPLSANYWSQYLKQLITGKKFPLEPSALFPAGI